MAYHTYTEVSDTNQNKIEFNCLNWVGFSRNSLLGIITVLVLAVAGLGGALIYLTTKPDIKRCQNDTTAVQPPDLTDTIKPSLNERWNGRFRQSQWILSNKTLTTLGQFCQTRLIQSNQALTTPLAVPPNSTAQLRVCKTNLGNDLTLAFPISHAIFSINQVQYEMFHHSTTDKVVTGLQHADRSK